MGSLKKADYKLLYAIKRGNVKKIQRLIKRYDLSDSPIWSGGYGLLCNAIWGKRTEVAKLLLKNGCRVNSKSRKPSMTPLHFAAENGDLVMVRILLDKGAHVNIKASDGRTPLLIAMKKRHILIVRLLLNHGASIDVESISWNTSDQTLLNFACTTGNEKFLELLCDRAYVNAHNSHSLTPFHIAVEHGDLKIIEYLMVHEDDVNCVHVSIEKGGYTALHIAAEEGDEKMIKLLLSKGSTIDARTEDNSTPLHTAIKNSRDRAAKVLLEHGADVNAKTVDNQTPLSLAAEHTNLTILRDVLHYRPDSSDEYNRLALCIAVRKFERHGRKIVADLLDYGLAISPCDIADGSLLYAAVKNGYRNIVEDLLKYGADANYLETTVLRKKSLLHIAVESSKKSVIKIPMVYRTDLKSKNGARCIAEYVDIEEKNLEVAEQLLGNKAHIEDETATGKGAKSIVQLLMNYGADVNSKDEDGHTPLYFAIKNDDLEITKQILDNKSHIIDSFDLLRSAIDSRNPKMIEILLSYNVDINATDKSGTNALHLTVSTGNTEEIFKLLLNGGIDVHAAQKNGETALFIAILNGEIEMVKILLEYTDDINAPLKGLITPLHVAARSGSKSITRMILARGANMHATLETGETPLYLACAKGCSEVVDLLLESGTGFDYGDKRGTTLLQAAIEYDHGRVVDILLKHDADIDFRDHKGLTALHIASRDGCLAVVDVLLENGFDINTVSDDHRTAFDFAHAKAEILNFEENFFDEAADISLNYSVSPDEIIVNHLQHHIIKLQAANCYLSKRNIDSIDIRYFRNFRTKCEKEVENMKSEKFSNNISLYNILTKGLHQIAVYLRNENVMQAFTTGDYITKFPMYIEMINNQFKRGTRRNDLLKRGERFFCVLFDNRLPMLPCACLDSIFTYLSNLDLKNLINAC